MRLLAIGFCALVLVGCKTLEDSAAQRGPDPLLSAQRDHDFCISIGVGPRHPQYSECRYHAALNRVAEEEKAAAEKRKMSQ